MHTVNRGEMYRASLILTQIGSYGFSDEAKRYIIAELTKTLKEPSKEKENSSDENAST